MNKDDLRILLNEKKVNPGIYFLDGGNPSEAYCINQNSGCWEVYYSERGCKTDLKVFDSESEACEYLLKRILDDGDAIR